MNKDKADAYIKDFLTLCRKHRIYIQGCGCCGSPWLEDMEDNEMDGVYNLDLGKEPGAMPPFDRWTGSQLDWVCPTVSKHKEPPE